MRKLLSFFLLNLFVFVIFAQKNPLWMRYPSVSPDGKTVAFAYKGDIYKVSASGGTAVALTQNPAYDYKPVWSPDGKTIAFASDRYGNFDIFTVSSKGGTPERLTFFSGKETPSSFSPDGKKILFSASIQDLPENTAFPRGYISELYYVPVNGGRIRQILSTPAEAAQYSKDETKIIYHDSKGPENYWRKHHTSSTTRDVRVFDKNTGKHKILSTYAGENRTPFFSADEKEIFFLSEQFDNNFNICKFNFSNPEKVTQITHFKNHPVRFLSVSDNDDLCFGYDGEIYIMKKGQEPEKISINIYSDIKEKPEEYMTETSGATDMDVSPDGKEIAFILRGNVFVTSTEYSTTKQITSTPEQERSVSFSPDGKAILYASERNGSWNVYQTKLIKDDETKFVFATELKEEVIIANKKENFQPKFSPDGKEVAFLEERTELKVINLKNKKIRTILKGSYNYSYSDGDQSYEWSPDSKSFLVSYSPNMLFFNDIALVNADGKSEPENLTLSGYSDSNAKWALKGKAMIWESDRNGYRSHGSWGSYRDVYAMFFTQDAYNKFKLSKEEYELYKETEKKKKEEESKKDKDKKVEDKKEKEGEKIKDIKIEKEGLEDRIAKLTINSSSISDAVLSSDGDKLYYLCKFEKGYDLWVNNLRKKETKLVLKLSGYGGSLKIDKDGKSLFMFSGGKIIKVSTSGYKKTPVAFKAEYYLNKEEERAYMFEHAWRQTYKKFYAEDMHGVDWEFYKKEYKKFLPYINNNYDFSELLSEMLGELNASHTGSGYRHKDKKGDKTASLGIFYDMNYTEAGIKISEVIEKGLLSRAKTEIKKGYIIEKIDGQKIEANKDFYQLLNHKTGKNVLLTVKNTETGKTFTETVKPISLGAENNLLYDRWVKNRRAETEKLSGGKIGYVHVKGMNSKSFRKVYSDLLGRNYKKEAVIIDTRYNHGGWLHDDLATLFSGKKYVDFVPRGHEFGYDPMGKWVKPSIVLMSEGNYSDAHGFPYVYTTLKIGKTVGMPVPGTMTAVWWESLQDKSLFFGIPQVGARDMNGDLLENKQLEPDFKIENEYDIIIKNRDRQLEKAVEVMLKELNEK
ncbi:MAG: S41 family peptidase [Bacteroidales bacterium]|nr:S41 family peptidase [Bacteroidales bacterium]